ncbi:Solute carrier 2 (Facilitated glucose transporter) member 8 [Bulinus truncatus]|nr:Solute carrier 2 (Facilitated glucose transporter) member 8 [Bulinus truncatus]
MAEKQIEVGSGRIVYSKYEGSHKKLICISICALIGALNFGIAIGYSSPSIPSMIKRGVLNKDESSWFGSLLTIGALFGGPLGGWLIEKIGRKLSLSVLSVPFASGFFIIASASESYQCYFGRFLTGVGSGMVTVCVPIYIAEISTASMRGILGSCVQLLVTIGIAAAYILGVFFEWRWLANLCIVPCVVGGILTYFIPETPRWLLMKNRKTEAIASLHALRDHHTNVLEECREMEDGADPEELVSFSEIIQKQELFYPLIIGVFIMIFQQLTGINVVMFFTVSIFESAVGDFAYTATVIVGIVQILATLIAVYLMDKAGRRKLLQLGAIIMAFTLFCFGLFYKLSSSGIIGGFLKTWFPVLCLTFFIIGFSLGWGPVPMLIMSEIIPTRCKGVASSVAVVASWGSAFIVTSQFSFMQELLDISGVFYLYSACCIISICGLFKVINAISIGS